jgi:hypothetical protein
VSEWDSFPDAGRGATLSREELLDSLPLGDSEPEREFKRLFMAGDFDGAEALLATFDFDATEQGRANNAA